MSPRYLNYLEAKTSQMYNTNSEKSVFIPCFNSATDVYKFFKYQGAKIWNKLPNVIKSACDSKMFKRLINEGNGPTCGCSYCKLCSLNMF